MAMNFDVAYFALDEETGQFYEGESDWADTVEQGKAHGDSADCDFYIVFSVSHASRTMLSERTGIVYVSPLRHSRPV